jgi:hypothetical protein
LHPFVFKPLCVIKAEQISNIYHNYVCDLSISCQTSLLFAWLGSCEHCNKHQCADVSIIFWLTIFRMYAQEWYHWIIWQFYFCFLRNLHIAFQNGCTKFTFPPTVYKGSCFTEFLPVFVIAYILGDSHSLHVQCNTHQNSNDIHYRDWKMNPIVHLESEKTVNSQGYREISQYLTSNYTTEP